MRFSTPRQHRIAHRIFIHLKNFTIGEDEDTYAQVHSLLRPLSSLEVLELRFWFRYHLRHFSIFNIWPHFSLLMGFCSANIRLFA